MMSYWPIAGIGLGFGLMTAYVIAKGVQYDCVELVVFPIIATFLACIALYMVHTISKGNAEYAARDKERVIERAKWEEERYQRDKEHHGETTAKLNRIERRLEKMQEEERK